MTLNNKNPKILLVDDDKFLIDMYSLKFRQNNWDVDTVFRAQEAIDKIEEDDHYDVVLLDLIMPAMDGFELLKIIRERKLCPETALVILSNQGQQSDIDKAEEYLVDGYIIKASTIPSEVVAQVTEILNNKDNQ